MRESFGWKVKLGKGVPSMCSFLREPPRMPLKTLFEKEKHMPIKKTTIVTADDDPQLLRLVARNLEFEGYNVLTASNGEIALEQIERHAPNLVLLDVMMPRMDGFTVCQKVR